MLSHATARIPYQTRTECLCFHVIDRAPLYQVTIQSPILCLRLILTFTNTVTVGRACTGTRLISRYHRWRSYGNILLRALLIYFGGSITFVRSILESRRCALKIKHKWRKSDNRRLPIGQLEIQSTSEARLKWRRWAIAYLVVNQKLLIFKRN